MLCVHLDVHKDVHAGNFGDIHWNQAAVSIVHQEISPQSGSTEVINAAGSISNIPQDEAMVNICKTDQQQTCQLFSCSDD